MNFGLIHSTPQPMKMNEVSYGYWSWSWPCSQILDKVGNIQAFLVQKGDIVTRCPPTHKPQWTHYFCPTRGSEMKLCIKRCASLCHAQATVGNMLLKWPSQYWYVWKPQHMMIVLLLYIVIFNLEEHLFDYCRIHE
jgi:hypothetical protein